MKAFLLYCVISYPGYAPHGHETYNAGHYSTYELCRRAGAVYENSRLRSQAICTCRKVRR